MDLCECARIVQAYAGAPVVNTSGAVVKLVISFKNPLKLVFWDSLATVLYRNFDISGICILAAKIENLVGIFPCEKIEAYLNLASTRGELNGVGQKVEANLVEFVLVEPCNERVLDAPGD